MTDGSGSRLGVGLQSDSAGLGALWPHVSWWGKHSPWGGEDRRVRQAAEWVAQGRVTDSSLVLWLGFGGFRLSSSHRLRALLNSCERWGEPQGGGGWAHSLDSVVRALIPLSLPPESCFRQYWRWLVGGEESVWTICQSGRCDCGTELGEAHRLAMPRHSPPRFVLFQPLGPTSGQASLMLNSSEKLQMKIFSGELSQKKHLLPRGDFCERR